MFDMAIGFAVGIVVGHYVPTIFTNVVAYIKSKSSKAGEVVAVADAVATSVTTK